MLTASGKNAMAVTSLLAGCLSVAVDAQCIRAHLFDDEAIDTTLFGSSAGVMAQAAARCLTRRSLWTPWTGCSRLPRVLRLLDELIRQFRAEYVPCRRPTASPARERFTRARH